MQEQYAQYQMQMQQHMDEGQMEDMYGMEGDEQEMDDQMM